MEMKKLVGIGIINTVYTSNDHSSMLDLFVR